MYRKLILNYRKLTELETYVLCCQPSLIYDKTKNKGDSCRVSYKVHYNKDSFTSIIYVYLTLHLLFMYTSLIWGIILTLQLLFMYTSLVWGIVLTLQLLFMYTSLEVHINNRYKVRTIPHTSEVYINNRCKWG
jgi:hypothetical protein